MRPSEVVQLPGQREGQQEVRYRKQLQALAFTSSGMTMLVALGAGPMAAGERVMALPVALGAMQREDAVVGSPAAAEHGVQSRPLSGCCDGSIAGRISRVVVVQQGLQVHAQAPHWMAKLPTRAWM